VLWMSFYSGWLSRSQFQVGLFILVDVVLLSVDRRGVFVGVFVFKCSTTFFVCTSPVYVCLVQGLGF